MVLLDGSGQLNILFCCENYLVSTAQNTIISFSRCPRISKLFKLKKASNSTGLEIYGIHSGGCIQILLALMENIMKIINRFLLIAVIGLFSQLSLAQGGGGALKEIADIVASINHFPSDANKTKLMAISDNGNLPQGLRDMATAVASINHSANAEGKEAMARLVAND